MNVFEAIKTRRSVRKYKPQPIPEDHLKQIMTAAQLAPSAGNRQPWRFILVKDPDTKKQLGTIARNQTETMQELKDIISWKIRRLDKVRSTLTMIVI